MQKDNTKGPALASTKAPKAKLTAEDHARISKERREIFRERVTGEKPWPDPAQQVRDNLARKKNEVKGSPPPESVPASIETPKARMTPEMHAELDRQAVQTVRDRLAGRKSWPL